MDEDKLKEQLEDMDEELESRLHILRPLPTGIEEYETWSNLIIEDCGITATPDSIKHTLAAMILSLGPGDAFKSNAYFIAALRKEAANQVALQVMQDLQDKKKAIIKAEKEAQKALELKEVLITDAVSEADAITEPRPEQ